MQAEAAQPNCSGEARAAARARGGARVVTTTFDNTVCVWDLRPDTGTLEEWVAIAERNPFLLDGIALVRRSLALPDSEPDA